MREILLDDRGPEMSRGSGAGAARGGTPAAPAHPGSGGAAGTPFPLEGRFVCPFCGAVNETADGPCPRCTMENTAEARKATKSRIGPWYVLQTRNPAAPGMKYETLLGFVRKGRVKARSVVRGPTTHQLWRFACQVKGLSREFGLCYSCGGSIERDAQICPQCNRLQDTPANPDAFLEGQAVSETPPAAPGASAGGVAFPGTGITFDTPPESSEPVVDRKPAAPVRSAPPAASVSSPVFKELKVPPASAAAPPAPAAAPDPDKPPVGRPQPSVEFPFAEPPSPQRQDVQTVSNHAPSAPGGAAPGGAPATAPSPGPGERPRKRPNDVFLSARDLAAAFQIGFDGDAETDTDLGDDAPWRAGQGGARGDTVATLRPPPRPRRRKRRYGRMLLVLILLGACAFGAYLAIDAAFRGRVFEWANARFMKLTGGDLHPDLAGRPARPSPTGTSPSPAAPAAAGVVSPRSEGPTRVQSTSQPAEASNHLQRGETDASDSLPPDPLTGAVPTRTAVAPPAPQAGTAPATGAAASAADKVADVASRATPPGGTTRAGPGATAGSQAPVADRATVRPPSPPTSAPAQRQVQAQSKPQPQPARPVPQVRGAAGEPDDEPARQAGAGSGRAAPAPPPAPAPAEDPARKARRLYFQALDADEAGDYRKAKDLYEQIKTLPRSVWPADLDSRLKFVNTQLEEK